MEDYIVVTFNVDFDDITTITNGYVQNCICDLPGITANCFNQTCEIDASDGPNLWKDWKIASDDQFCPATKFSNKRSLSKLCIDKHCKFSKKKHGIKAKSCAKQAKPFFKNPEPQEGYAPQESALLLVNGQLEPTLPITANTWVRLRLGFMATMKVL